MIRYKKIDAWNNKKKYNDGPNGHVYFLYKMLKERESHINISFIMPTELEHIDFVSSRSKKIYKTWQIIYFYDNPIGNFYISNDNEIGLFILKEYQGKGFGKTIMRDIISFAKISGYGSLYANINPDNVFSIEFFKKNDFEILQHTYKLNV